MTLVTDALTIIFIIGAAIQDLRTRTISNAWNLLWLIGFIVLHVIHGLWLPSVVGVVGMGLVMLVPAIRGVYGVGDWKMGMVLGAALGYYVAAIVLVIALILQLFAPLKRWMQKHSGELLKERARTIPFAAPTCLSAVFVLAGGYIYHIAR